MSTLDALGRPLHDLRISVTDRCNFRCVYCMPKEVFNSQHRFLGRSELLSFEEITRLVRASAQLGVRKIRFTGGEPLVRRDLEQLIAMVAAIEGIDDMSLTTNASLLSAERARQLRDAGLERINVSLDALDDATFMAVNDVGVPVVEVLRGIDNAIAAGMRNIKVNMVVKKGLNEHAIVPMAKHFHGSGVILRFIEFMDVGNHNQWQHDSVLSASEIHRRIHRELALENIDPNYPGEVAKRWRYCDGGGEIGIIASVTQPFCGDCHRARLSAVGQLYTCLFASGGTDLRQVLRSGVSDEALLAQLRALWSARSDRYSEQRGRQPSGTQPLQFRPKVEMSYIGG